MTKECYENTCPFYEACCALGVNYGDAPIECGECTSLDKPEESSDDLEIADADIMQLLTAQVAEANKSLMELRERLAETLAEMKDNGEPK